MATKRNSLTDGAAASSNGVDQLRISKKTLNQPKAETGVSGGAALVPGDRLENAKKANSFQALSPAQKKQALATFKVVSDKLDTSSDPVLHEDGTFEMKLMKGGLLKMVESTGQHVMEGKRQMMLFDEKGNRHGMLNYYVMLACITIDGVPITVADVGDKLTGRDFLVVDEYFRTLNLI